MSNVTPTDRPTHTGAVPADVIVFGAPTRDRRRGERRDPDAAPPAPRPPALPHSFRAQSADTRAPWSRDPALVVESHTLLAFGATAWTRAPQDAGNVDPAAPRQFWALDLAEQPPETGHGVGAPARFSLRLYGADATGPRADETNGPELHALACLADLRALFAVVDTTRERMRQAGYDV